MAAAESCISTERGGPSGPCRTISFGGSGVLMLLATPFVKRQIQRRIDARPAGPSGQELKHGACFVWGRVEDARGNSREARLRGPNGYLLTAHTALQILRRVLDGQVTPGFRTPAQQYGWRMILDVAGTSIS